MKNLDNSLRSLLHEVREFSLIMKEKIQFPLKHVCPFDKEDLKIIKKFSTPENYSYISNLYDLSLEEKFNIQKAIGFRNDGFTLTELLSCISPGIYTYLYAYYAMGVYELINNHPNRKAFHHSIYTIDYPVSRGVGLNYSINQKSRFWEVGASGYLASNFNSCIATPIKAKQLVVVRPRLIHQSNNSSFFAKEEAELIKKVTTQIIEKFKLFTKTQERILLLRYYEGLNSPKIADKFGESTTVAAIRDQEKRIKNHARKIFDYQFSNINEVTYIYAKFGFLQNNLTKDSK